jgi:hypothetical protein
MLSAVATLAKPQAGPNCKTTNAASRIISTLRTSKTVALLPLWGNTLTAGYEEAGPPLSLFSAT